MKNLKWLLPPAFAVFACITLHAQVSEGFKQIKNNEFEDALKTFEELVENSEDSLPAQWGKALVLGDSTFAGHKYDEAMAIKNSVEQSLRKVKDDKLKEKWEKKYDLNAENMKTFAKTLPHLRWAEIAGKNNLEDLDKFEALHLKYASFKIKKEAQKQQATALRLAANGGAYSYSAIKYVLTRHLDYIQDSFPGRPELLRKELFPAFLREKGEAIDQVEAFMKENPDHKISMHGSRNKLDAAYRENTAPAYLSFLTGTQGTPYDDYVYRRISELLKANPLTETQKAKMTQDEIDLADDILKGASSGIRVIAGSKYDGNGLPQWKTYIKRNAGKTSGADALRSVVQYSMDGADWKTVVAMIDEFGTLFPEQATWNKNIRQIAAAPDDDVHPVMLKNKISSTTANEYVPTISADGRLLAFCGNDRKDGIGKEDIFICERKDTSWSEPRLVTELSTKTDYEAPLCFTADGNTMVVFKGGKVYLSDRNATGWGPLKTFPVSLSNFAWVADVHFVPGEQRVFFAAQTDAVSGIDIYMAAKDDNDVWGAPTKLKAPINSPGNDRSPFIHPDQRTLYFSSERSDGLGKLDVYKTERLDDTWENWSEPVNLGKSINNSTDNWGYIVTTDGKTAYYSAKAKGKTQDDLFYIDLPVSMRPQKEVKYLAVEVRDNTGKAMNGVKVEMRNTRTGISNGEYRTPPNSGKTTILLPDGGEYTISAIKSGFLCNPVTLEVANSKSNKETVILTMIPVAELKDKKTEINADILFDPAKSDLKPEAAAQIRFLADFVKSEKMVLDLGGYTDPTGNDEDNMKLSQARADAVRTALVNAGVKAENITATGFGETNLACKEATTECYKKCRRVEIKWK